MKLALARAMLQKADILLLDEPTNHLDVTNVAWIQVSAHLSPASAHWGGMGPCCHLLLHAIGRGLHRAVPAAAPDWPAAAAVPSAPAALRLRHRPGLAPHLRGMGELQPGHQHALPVSSDDLHLVRHAVWLLQQLLDLPQPPVHLLLASRQPLQCLAQARGVVDARGRHAFPGAGQVSSHESSSIGACAKCAA